jgi:FKBP-type peptidyl-prolyl cis-trans isomerase
MKNRLLLVGTLCSTLILSACGTSEPEQSEQPENTTANVEQQALLPNNEATTMNCKQAIQEYLQNADLQGAGTEIKAGDNITVNYIGRTDEETVFDTNVESVAKACGTYNEAINYTEGLTFDVGSGQMIAGFDAGVLGMKI